MIICITDGTYFLAFAMLDTAKYLCTCDCVDPNTLIHKIPSPTITVQKEWRTLGSMSKLNITRAKDNDGKQLGLSRR